MKSFKQVMTESKSITEGALGKQWVNGAKRVKSGSITLVKAKNPDADLHTVMKNGKKVGTFVFDDGPDAFSVTNMSTKKVSWADQIDDIPRRVVVLTGKTLRKLHTTSKQSVTIRTHLT
jgi:hypothetical protein